MQLYAGGSARFIEDAVQNQVADKLRAAFFDHYRFHPGPGEVSSWRNSLSKMKDVLQRARLLDHGVALEYQLPLSSRRLDCMLTGRDASRRDQAVIVELKQWEDCEPCDGDNEVLTFLGGAKRPALHPSVQVNQYETYLKDCQTVFYEEPGPVGLSSCAYLHNHHLQAKDALLAPKFKQAVQASPVFGAQGVDELAGFLTQRLGAGQGLPVLDRVQGSAYRASKKLLEHVGKIIQSHKPFVLLDEQLVVYDRVIAAARRGLKGAQKKVIVVHGGPGTGKSVIAINLMADLSRQGAQTHYATGSKAFTETLRKITGTRASAQFKYFNSYMGAERDALDVLVLDESHRIRESSNNRFTKKDKRSDLRQIDELLHAARVCVFFIDDLQVVRPNEVGSSKLIVEAAQARGADIEEHHLEAQFRCSGSDGFMNWIDNTLGVRRTANILWKGDPKFEFKLFDSPQQLEDAIREKAAQGASARMTAGYCWEWSEKPKADGTLEDDVQLGDYKRPWNARPESVRLAKGIPKASLWAYEPGGIDQVGCVYTAQGFEFDYVGVIFGQDLFYNPKLAQWEGRPQFSHDNAVRRSKAAFTDLVKNTYRVLLSRGLKGCYVHFVDPETRAFFLSRMEGLAPQPRPAAAELKILQDLPAHLHFKGYLPVYTLAAAAGGFSDSQAVRPLGWAAVDYPKLSSDMFIARVKGRSMEPTIPDGSYCIFRADRGGTRDGKIVLVESSRVSDPDTSARYTVKRYRSEKELFDDGTWRHKRITLAAENPDYQDIVLHEVDPGEFRVAAEYVGAVG